MRDDRHQRWHWTFAHESWSAVCAHFDEGWDAELQAAYLERPLERRCSDGRVLVGNDSNYGRAWRWETADEWVTALHQKLGEQRGARVLASLRDWLQRYNREVGGAVIPESILR